MICLSQTVSQSLAVSHTESDGGVTGQRPEVETRDWATGAEATSEATVAVGDIIRYSIAVLKLSDRGERDYIASDESRVARTYGVTCRKADWAVERSGRVMNGSRSIACLQTLGRVDNMLYRCMVPSSVPDTGMDGAVPEPGERMNGSDAERQNALSVYLSSSYSTGLGVDAPGSGWKTLQQPSQPPGWSTSSPDGATIPAALWPSWPALCPLLAHSLQPQQLHRA